MKFNLKHDVIGTKLSYSKMPNWLYGLVKDRKAKIVDASSMLICGLSTAGEEWQTVTKEDVILKLKCGIFIIPAIVADEILDVEMFNSVPKDELIKTLRTEWDAECKKWKDAYAKTKGCE